MGSAPTRFRQLICGELLALGFLFQLVHFVLIGALSPVFMRALRFPTRAFQWSDWRFTISKFNWTQSRRQQLKYGKCHKVGKPCRKEERTVTSGRLEHKTDE